MAVHRAKLSASGSKSQYTDKGFLADPDVTDTVILKAPTAGMPCSTYLEMTQQQHKLSWLVDANGTN